MTKKITKLLIANRGEIACRIIRTCKRLGIKTVAVYSDADRKAMHTMAADEAIHIGPAPASESYLKIDTLIDAAKTTQADAVHPGYGFLSENPDFANACAQNDIIFVGPSADSMNAMALKGAAKKLMENSGVPVVPGYHGDEQSDETLIAEAKKIGMPVLIKAVAGGGGKGMRAVHNENELEAAIIGARREGQNSFGNDKLLIEKLIEVPRHIEVQVFGDARGKAVHIFERDCSLQRRHQKVIEEAPAPGMPLELRAQMGEAAVKAAEAIAYQGAGTVEFIVDVAGGLEGAPFYFMEMNTRLQVEHPVTEMISDLDLVEWQLTIAEGNNLPLEQNAVDGRLNGHAVEVRLYAEDPDNDFLPVTGEIGLFDPFTNIPDYCRIETGVQAGDTVSIHYDPMISKVVAWGQTRDEALARLTSQLSSVAISGLKTNRDFLIRCLIHSDFIEGKLDTGFIGRNMPNLKANSTIEAKDFALATLAVLANRAPSEGHCSLWNAQDNFRLSLPNTETISFVDDAKEIISVSLVHTSSGYTLTVQGQSFLAALISHTGTSIDYSLNGYKQTISADVTNATVTLVLPTKTIVCNRYEPGNGSQGDMDGPGSVISPMPGKILSVFAKNDEEVEKDQPLLILEAMKMEHTIKAPRTGTVSDLTIQEGDQVTGGALLFNVQDTAS